MPVLILTNCDICGAALVRKKSSVSGRYACQGRCRADMLWLIRGRIDAVERFWSFVDKTPGQGPTGECWEWVKARVPETYEGRRVWPVSNYGSFNVKLNGVAYGSAHRFSYFIHKGPIPEGLQVGHDCHHPPCVNPDHLKAMTAQENMEQERGKPARRQRTNGMFVLIRNEYGVQIACRYTSPEGKAS